MSGARLVPSALIAGIVGIAALAGVAGCSSDDDGGAPTTVADTAPAWDVTAGCDPTAEGTDTRAAFVAMACEAVLPVAELRELLSIPLPTASELDQLRSAVCDPDTTTSDREKVETTYRDYISGYAERDPDRAERWLEAGVLDHYERTDRLNDLYLIDIEVNAETVTRLADAELAIFEAVGEDPSRYCDV